MWIRSQDGKALSNVNNLYVRVIGKGYAISSDKCDLGKYSTEQKAMKIMNIIQRQIASRSERYEIVRPVLRSDPFEPYWKKCEVVFQMPKDDEVGV